MSKNEENNKSNPILIENYLNKNFSNIKVHIFKIAEKSLQFFV